MKLSGEAESHVISSQVWVGVYSGCLFVLLLFNRLNLVLTCVLEVIFKAKGDHLFFCTFGGYRSSRAIILRYFKLVFRK